MEIAERMAVQIANPAVVAKIEELARSTGLSKTAAVEQAVDATLQHASRHGDLWERFDAIVAQMDRVPRFSAPADPLEWDERGLPR